MNSAVSAPTLGAIFLFKGIFVQCLQYMPGRWLTTMAQRSDFAKNQNERIFDA